jgi:hypothetical protein
MIDGPMDPRPQLFGLRNRKRWVAWYASPSVIDYRDLRVRLVMSAFAASVAVAAQSGESVLSIDDGKAVRPIARLVSGRWVGETACASSGTSQIGEARLKASGGLKQSPVRAVVPGSTEWLRLAPTIVGLFEQREREQRLLSDKTSDAPRAVDWIYVNEDAARRTYYFEASRRVANASSDVDHDTDPPGTVRIAVAGFLLDASNRLTPLGTKSELRWEQDGLPAGPVRPDLMPLGVVATGEQSIWVMKGQSGTRKWFTLYDVSTTGTRTLLTARADRC